MDIIDTCKVLVFGGKRYSFPVGASEKRSHAQSHFLLPLSCLRCRVSESSAEHIKNICSTVEIAAYVPCARQYPIRIFDILL